MTPFKIPAIRISLSNLLAIFAVQTALAGLLLADQTPFGTSQVHTALIGILAAATLALAGLAVFPHRLAGYLNRLVGASRGPRWLNGLTLACFLLAVAGIFGTSLLEGYAQSFPASPAAVYARWVDVPGLCLALIALETGLWVLHHYGSGASEAALNARRKTERVFLNLAGVLALLAGLSGLGVRDGLVGGSARRSKSQPPSGRLAVSPGLGQHVPALDEPAHQHRRLCPPPSPAKL